ncbi:bifunctional histidinal dehydrogenase and histidinol dehydrogenase [Tenacibaculum maritimum]|uniref:histidinol dehydrogenase n=1 Tax=Tenacibaculum maritimum TaxID=107401 RepID=UPI0012E52D07|nr:histidinol dehydrogenase [Tenacibaculum maritimum]CAA0147983.1 bifunctional histidinal dehydrogenase and histidinol dehydrogenase [Tenacibaculum maritimum]CAA0171997.1 bifunctional histidinal dehydrogenase and histidinol dehydrogenase [Tenacibaculum maritimum]CAA0200568.1 bifunctional histidinal dehydrogenase and histidinol dehydrogenase [Tenacibaculum maritimum]
MKVTIATQENQKELLKRPTKTVAAIEEEVYKIFEEVAREGDRAIQKYTTLFDGVSLDHFLIKKEEIKEAEKQVPTPLKKAIQQAKKNIEKFHKAQKVARIKIETVRGVVCWKEQRPIEKVGLYIPGGTAPLFSTILMLAVPARIAGCKELILCTPPNKEGNVNPVILYAAALCGVTNVYKVGGIQAIAALTFGTETIGKVSKIFGPGNQYVTVAKQLATKYEIAIDMPAGPSELLVLADASADPAFVASDLLSQAEHGVDSQVTLVSDSLELINETLEEIKKQLLKLPRKNIVKKALENAQAILIKDKYDAINFVNEYAPEHLIITTRNDDFFIEKLINAGSVFIGKYTPESAGDYASGTNHTLPTNGFAKAYSGVNLDSFMKSITFQKISKKGIQNIGEIIEIMAEAEGLQAHKNAVSLRLKRLSDTNIDN